MPMYSMDHDPEFWQAPERFATLPAVAEAINTRVSIFALGDAEVEETPVAVVFEMTPGYVINRHAHPSERLEVVVRGSIQAGDRVLYPGDVMTAGDGELYGPKVAGIDGCTTVEFFATTTGAYMRISDEPGGLRVSNLLEELSAAFVPTSSGTE